MGGPFAWGEGMSKTTSFTAAGSLPLKLVKNRGFLDALPDIRPVHVQFIPTNRCNLKCSFCSCANVDRGEEMRFAEIEVLIEHLAKVGTQSVTITGGGDPLMHPRIDDIIAKFAEHGIEMGLVTNGTLFGKVKPESLSLLTWCRISCSDERSLPDLSTVVQADTDWAFSYVLSAKPNLDNLRDHIEFAEAYGFTHVRVVSDLLDVEHSKVSEVREHFDSELVIWQDRQEYTRGVKDCRISLLKPVIGPDGLVFPCCGVQYAQQEASLDLPESMAMGYWGDIGNLTCFDGRQCAKCYYEGYNTLLAALVDDIEHVPFV